MPAPGSRLGFWSRTPAVSSLEIGCSVFPTFTPSSSNNFNPFSAYPGFIDKTTSGVEIKTRFISAVLSGTKSSFLSLSKVENVGSFSRILYDIDGKSNYGSADFVRPGTPWEGFCTQIKQGTSVFSTNRSYIISTAPGTERFIPSDIDTLTLDPAQLWQLGTNHYGSILGSRTTGYMINQILIYPDEPIIRMHLSYTNTSSGNQIVWMMRGLDPDQDVFPGGDYKTNNTRGYKDIPTNQLVSAQGTREGNKTIAILTTKNTAETNTPIVTRWPTECYYPDKWLATSDAEGLTDWAVCGMFSFGRVDPGQTVSACMYYMFGTSLLDIYRSATLLR